MRQLEKDLLVFIFLPPIKGTFILNFPTEIFSGIFISIGFEKKEIKGIITYDNNIQIIINDMIFLKLNIISNIINVNNNTPIAYQTFAAFVFIS